MLDFLHAATENLVAMFRHHYTKYCYLICHRWRWSSEQEKGVLSFVVTDSIICEQNHIFVPLRRKRCFFVKCLSSYRSIFLTSLGSIPPIYVYANSWCQASPQLVTMCYLPSWRLIPNFENVVYLIRWVVSGSTSALTIVSYNDDMVL